MGNGEKKENTLSTITIQDVERGYKDGIIRLIHDPKGNGTAYEIRECQFTFGGLAAEEYGLEKFKETVPEDESISEIFEVIEDMRYNPEFADEYGYYQSVLL